MRQSKKQIDPNLKPEELERQAYARSVRLLGSREHSSSELRSKLANSGFGGETIDAVLQQLIDSGYQSDERFAHLYSEQLLRKNYGPLAISAKLGARGIDSGLSRTAISAAIAESGLCWSEVAAEALVSKFSTVSRFSNPSQPPQLAQPSDEHSPTDAEYEDAQSEHAEERQREKGKYARFLNRRGFSTTDSIKAIRLALETVPE